MNAQPAVTGPNETDNAAIADHARRIRDMLNVRRNNGNLIREEFWAVVTPSTASTSPSLSSGRPSSRR